MPTPTKQQKKNDRHKLLAASWDALKREHPNLTQRAQEIYMKVFHELAGSASHKGDTERKAHAWVSFVDHFLEMSGTQARPTIEDKNLRQAIYPEKAKASPMVMRPVSLLFRPGTEELTPHAKRLLATEERKVTINEEKNEFENSEESSTEEEEKKETTSTPTKKKSKPKKQQVRRRRRRQHWVQEIRRLQKSVEPQIPRASFRRLVREIWQNVANGPVKEFCFEKEVYDVLREATESHLVTMFENANLATIHRKALTVTPKDLQLVNYLYKPSPAQVMV